MFGTLKRLFFNTINELYNMNIDVFCFIPTMGYKVNCFLT